MSHVLASIKLVLADVAELQIPTIATAVAGLLAPVIASIAGASITAPEVTGWLLLAGAVAAGLQKILTGQTAKK